MSVYDFKEANILASLKMARAAWKALPANESIVKRDEFRKAWWVHEAREAFLNTKYGAHPTNAQIAKFQYASEKIQKKSNEWMKKEFSHNFIIHVIEYGDCWPVTGWEHMIKKCRSFDKVVVELPLNTDPAFFTAV